MDESLLWVALLMTFMGFMGVILPYTTPFPTEFCDLQGLGGFILAFGILLIPVAVFKDGLPVLTSRAKAVIGMAVLVVFSEVLLFAFLQTSIDLAKCVPESL